jgi:hypothetical protein
MISKTSTPQKKYALRSLLLTSSLFLLLTSMMVVAMNANFSGDWKLNESKSDLGEFGSRFAPKKLKITGQADGMSVDRVSVNQQGEEVTMTEKLTFDGKEAESTVFGSSKKKSTTKWSDDGQVLTVNSTIMFERNGETTEIKMTEVYKLIDNGQALSVESTSNSSFGTNAMKLLYEKAK